MNGGEVRLLSGRVKGTLVGLLPGMADEREREGFEDKFSIGSGRMHRELGVSFWKHLPSWVDEGSVRPLGYEVVEGLDGRGLMKY